uniref:DUF4200 domain-containing protein n=1 Tax=Chromera velia CCMP2878 TaxID=1169474 RepID=A0A0G4G9W2_9ALVE|eukprot:Cvel_4396.t1-p1 / transcript=Cvel_4396.t1 / gene=Cvel_4396 / organism=Chromera_velia_CCMP2878 / gene_product=Coiled-coil domain-containing protein 37, putative / transcript_product=Coiled-coil domain-containing protein 37, putative / location=Cvel_scaffold191:25207-34777(+) / protein_length=565 / sequence_SO=supercontig / SO=protein_coding / is_pseudo=false
MQSTSPLTTAREGGDDSLQNPFSLPSDEEIFMMREQERRKRMEERKQQQSLKVEDKMTACSRMRRIQRVDQDTGTGGLPNTLQGSAGGATGGSGAGGAGPSGTQQGGAGGAGGSGGGSKQDRSKNTDSLQKSLKREPAREKETVRDFIAKKREMFLVQMSLDIKKAEILKLHEQAAMKEFALKKSQKMLEEDVTRFDAFLTANDTKAHEALVEAETLMREKQARVQRIKHLRTQISVVESEISKHREQATECRKYRAFLDRLTPQEWTMKKVAEKAQRKALRRERYLSKKQEEADAVLQKDIMDLESQLETELQQEEKTRRGKGAEDYKKEVEDSFEKKKRAAKRKAKQQMENADKEYEDVSSGEELPLYFKEPKQLLEVFKALEEQNLFLIQNGQEAEQRQVTEQRDECRTLQQTLSAKTERSSQDQMLKELTNKVLQVYLACGFEQQEKDRRVDPLKLLEQIEVKLEELLASLEDYPEKLVEELEREKERERRKRVRDAKIALQNKKAAERLAASQKRSQEPVKRRVGKLIMFRSPPVKQERKVVVRDETAELAELEQKLFFS